MSSNLARGKIKWTTRHVWNAYLEKGDQCYYGESYNPHLLTYPDNKKIFIHNDDIDYHKYCFA